MISITRTMVAFVLLAKIFTKRHIFVGIILIFSIVCKNDALAQQAYYDDEFEDYYDNYQEQGNYRSQDNDQYYYYTPPQQHVQQRVQPYYPGYQQPKQAEAYNNQYAPSYGQAGEKSRQKWDYDTFDY